MYASDDYYGTYSGRVGTMPSPQYVRQSPLYYKRSMETFDEKPPSRSRCCTWVAAILFFILILLVVGAIVFFLALHNSPWFNQQISFTGSALSLSLKTRIMVLQRGTVESPKFSTKHGLAAGKEKARMVERSVVENMLRENPESICLLDSAYYTNEAQELFDEEHIKGAQRFDIERVVNRSLSYRRQLRHPVIFEEYARSLGITRDCLVVIYHHSETPTSQVTATYVWWLFKVHGVEEVAVMKGGLKEWKMETHLQAPIVETTNSTVPPSKGNFEVSWNGEHYASIEDVVENYAKGKYDLVDARSLTDYRGETKSSLADVGGRLKGSINIPSASLLDKNGSLKPDDELKLIAQDAGLVYNRAIIVYCNTGMQSSAVHFMLTRLGYTTTMYNGGWIEFSRAGPDEFKVLAQ